MPDIDYYTSERVIWDNLKKYAEAGVKSLYEQWKTKGSIDPFAVTWPGTTIFDLGGLPVTGPCTIELKRAIGSWSVTLRRLVEITDAYALLLVEQKDNDLQVILESHHGTRSWTIPIRQSGDVRVLGDPTIQDNVNRIGILWEPRSSPAS